MNRKISADNIDYEIQELQKLKIKILDILQQPSKTLHEEILRKYIELQSVTEVADYFNQQEYCVEEQYYNGQVRERKFTSNDISHLIKMSKDKIEAEEDLIIFTKTLFNYKCKKASWRNLIKLAQ
ncbi:MAG: hypothetical protein ACOYVK_14685 [Bacillota bacterium]